MRLDAADRKRLLKTLDSMPLLESARTRRRLLEFAGLESLIPQIDLEGPAFIAAGEIVHVLEEYGRVNANHEALGVFLNAMIEFSGSSSEANLFLASLLEKYSLMKPVRPADQSVSWKKPFADEDALEKIIGENTLRHVHFLQTALSVARCVAFLDVGRWVGTGFLIAKNLLLTNNHVVPANELISTLVCRFNFQLTPGGAFERAEEVRALPAGVFHTSKELDYSILELENTPGDRWGCAPLATHGVPVGARVNIIQHPAGLPKQVSLQNNFVEYANRRVVQYITSTLPGSSGAPVFDDDWKVVALHHAGGMIAEPETRQRYLRNEGIAIGAIIEDLPSDIRVALS